MSKKNKRQIIQQGIDDANAYYNKRDAEKNREKELKKNDPAKPNLLKRFASILLDGLMVVAVTAGLYLAAYVTIFPKLGYQSSVEEVQQLALTSGLYIETSAGEIKSITDAYDETKKPGENYDAPITHYYTVDSRAIANNMYEAYCNAKKNSNLFVVDGEGTITERTDILQNDLKTFYQNEYNNAVAFFNKNPRIIQISNQTLLIAVVSMMACALLSTSIFYFMVPMLRKEGETLGQMACRLVLVNAEDKKKPNRGQIAIRFAVLFITVYLLPISLYIQWSYIAGLPIFVVAAMIAFKKDNGAFHDFFSKTKIINKTRTNAFASLEAMKKAAEQQKMMQGGDNNQ